MKKLKTTRAKLKPSEKIIGSGVSQKELNEKRTKTILRAKKPKK